MVAVVMWASTDAFLWLLDCNAIQSRRLEAYNPNTRFIAKVAFPAVHSHQGSSLYTSGEPRSRFLGLRFGLGDEDAALLILVTRRYRSDCGSGDRLQSGNSVSVSQSCNVRNGVIADAAVSSFVASTRSSI